MFMPLGLRRFSTSLLLTGLLVVFASLGGGWGQAYGATGGPTPTPSDATLAIAKEGDIAQARPGQTVVFTVRTTNNGSLPARAAQIVDEMPNQFEVMNALASQGTVSVSGQTVTVAVPQLDPGVTVVLTIEGRVRQGAQGQIVNQATARAVNVQGVAITEQRARAVVNLDENVASDAAGSAGGGNGAGNSTGNGAAEGSAPGAGSDAAGSAGVDTDAGNNAANSAANRATGGSSPSPAGQAGAEAGSGPSSYLSNTGADGGIRWTLLVVGLVLIGVGAVGVRRIAKTS